MKVYISSTYRDLKDYRESVYIALRKMKKINVIAMEDYVAMDHRPVDKCLFDVSTCDVYIGIFAWRYGFIPVNYDHSITELEYRKAVNTKKTKLIFILNNKAKWPEAQKDKTLNSILRLRNELEDNHIVSYFETKEELTNDIVISISNLLSNNIDENKPIQLPPKVHHFTNREIELTNLINELHPGNRITICGPGGIGKSALASMAIWKFYDNKEIDKFPDGILWHDFYSNRKTQDALENIALSFGEKPIPTPEIAAKRALSGKQAIILLDGAEEADNLSMLINIAGDCCIIITTRKKSDAIDQREDIQIMQPYISLKLFQAWSRTNKDIESAQKICDLTGGLPLAIRIAGKYIYETGEPLEEYLLELRNTPLDALDHGTRKLESVPVLLKQSLKQVGENAVKILSVTSILAFTSFSKEVLTYSIPDMNLKKSIKELIGYGLLNRVGERLGISHALIHAYVKENHIPSNEIAEKVVNYFVSYVKEKRKKGSEGMSAMDAERIHIMHLIKECKSRGLWHSINSLVFAADEGYFDLCGYWEDSLIARKFGVEASSIVNDKFSESLHLNNIASIYYSRGVIEKAIEYYEKALAISKKLGDKIGEASDLGSIGAVYYFTGNVDKALAYYFRSLAICKETGEKHTTSTILENIGKAYGDLGQIETSMNFYIQSLKLSRELNCLQNVCSTLNRIGALYHTMIMFEKAIDCFQEALVISQEIADRRLEGKSLGNLGKTYGSMGNAVKSIEYNKKALKISREIGNRNDESIHIGALATAYLQLGDIEKAKEYFSKSINIFEDIKSPYAKIVKQLLKMDSRLK